MSYNYFCCMTVINLNQTRSLTNHQTCLYNNKCKQKIINPEFGIAVYRISCILWSTRMYQSGQNKMAAMWAGVTCCRDLLHKCYWSTHLRLETHKLDTSQHHGRNIVKETQLKEEEENEEEEEEERLCIYPGIFIFIWRSQWK